MSILIGAYEFDGPFYHANKFEDRAGVYAILHQQDDLYELIDIAHSESVCASLNNQIVADLHSTYPEPILMAVCYTPDLRHGERQAIADSIVRELDEVEELVAC
jgi:hypothetical protein